MVHIGLVPFQVSGIHWGMEEIPPPIGGGGTTVLFTNISIVYVYKMVYIISEALVSLDRVSLTGRGQEDGGRIKMRDSEAILLPASPAPPLTTS